MLHIIGNSLLIVAAVFHIIDKVCPKGGKSK